MRHYGFKRLPDGGQVHVGHERHLAAHLQLLLHRQLILLVQIIDTTIQIIANDDDAHPLERKSAMFTRGHVIFRIMVLTQNP